MSWTQATLVMKDAAGANQPIIAYTDGTNFSFAHPLLDSTGAIFDPAQKSAVANISGGASTWCASGASGGNPLLTAAAVNIKINPGNVYGWDFYNPNLSGVFVQVFDALAASVTLGTTPPKIVKWVPPGGAWEEKFSGEGKLTFATAISMAVTTTATGSAAATSGVLANIEYK